MCDLKVNIIKALRYEKWSATLLAKYKRSTVITATIILSKKKEEETGRYYLLWEGIGVLLNYILEADQNQNQPQPETCSRNNWTRLLGISNNDAA